jgi:nucleoside 2-deoxyribosyltransferase
MTTVYLGGPIEGVSKEEARGWRKAASLFYEERGITVLDPTRRVPFIEREYSHATSVEVVLDDLKDIENSDILLVNLKDRGKGLCWGSVWEIAYTFCQYKDKLIIVVLEEGFNHPFIDFGATKIVRSLEQGLEESLRELNW